MSKVAEGRGLFLNRRWCCKCHTPKDPKGGKIKGKNTGHERFTCRDCLT